jgi:hypothetical protein
MAFIGQIKEVFIEDGQILCSVETGTNQGVTAFVMQAGGMEAYPARGDYVLCQRADKEVAVVATWSEESSTSQGDVLLFSRSASGNVAASVRLSSDGSALCENGSGSFELASNGRVSINGSNLTVDP